MPREPGLLLGQATSGMPCVLCAQAQILAMASICLGVNGGTLSPDQFGKPAPWSAFSMAMIRWLPFKFAALRYLVSRDCQMVPPPDVEKCAACAGAYPTMVWMQTMS